ncbi:hypothetical protein ABIE67_001193 [Streptomyces sp. V4I8]|uniref:hypothetical protein n=1 Tax=Streptomyces sp. V4I8 TaxID=3156469 RepID=UPI003518951E
MSLPRKRLDQVAGLRLTRRDGFGALPAQLLTQLSEDTHACEPDDGPRLGTVVIDLLSALFAQALDTGD